MSGPNAAPAVATRHSSAGRASRERADRQAWRELNAEIERARLERLKRGCTCGVASSQSCRCPGSDRARLARLQVAAASDGSCSCGPSGCGCRAARDRAKLDELRRGAGLPPAHVAAVERDVAKLAAARLERARVRASRI